MRREKNRATGARSGSRALLRYVFTLPGSGLLLVLLVTYFFTQPIRALNAVNPIFTTTLGGGAAGIVRHSSPILADVDGNSSNGLEIVVGTTQNEASEGGYAAYLSVLKSDGTPLWERSVEGHVESSPAVGDINSDGHNEVVAGLGARNEPQLTGGLVAYDRNGNRLWRVTTLDRSGGGAGWTQPNTLADGVFASPSIADVNNDDQNEVAFAAWDHRVYVVRGTDGQSITGSNGEPCGSSPYYCWPAEMLDTIWSSTAIADLNGDGYKDIVFGGDISENAAAGTQNGGMLRAMYDHPTMHPTYLPGWNTQYGNICTGGSCPTDIGHYGVYADQVFYSSPAIGDINNDGNYEIVIGSGRAFSAGTLGHWVKVYDYQGNLLRTLDTDGVVFGSPALADLNGDGYLDIVVGTEILDDNAALAGRGTMYAWSGKDYSQLWHTDPAIIIGHQAIMPITSSPIVADIDPTQSGPEVLFGLGPEICVLSASGQQLTADNLDSTKPTLWIGLSPSSNSPAVADIDGDGTLEIVAAGEYYPITNPVRNYHGWVVAWHWPGADGNAIDANLPWPMFRRNAEHTAFYAKEKPPTPPGLSVSPSSIYVLHQYGDTSDVQTTLRITNTGEGSFDWDVLPPSGEVTIFPTIGSFPTDTLTTVTIATRGYTTGTQDLGDIIVDGIVAGNPITGSPALIPVTLHVVDQLYEAFLPTVLKGYGQ